MAEICTSCRAAMRFGNATSRTSPCPSSPVEPSPHEKTSPAWLTTRVQSRYDAAATIRTAVPRRASTRAGMSCAGWGSPSPRPRRRPVPHEKRIPSSVTAKLLTMLDVTEMTRWPRNASTTAGSCLDSSSPWPSTPWKPLPQE
eukprot:scaffold14084_cov140-Isochrysis_galbana.AAC.2